MTDSEGKMEQPEELYCDDCGAVLQRESCNHVRACTQCSITASIKLRNAEELRDSRGELLAQVQLQLATAEAELERVRRELEETKKDLEEEKAAYRLRKGLQEQAESELARLREAMNGLANSHQSHCFGEDCSPCPIKIRAGATTSGEPTK